MNTNPAFILRRIDFQLIQKNYQDGKYKHVTREFLLAKKKEEPEVVVFSSTQQQPKAISYINTTLSVPMGSPISDETFKLKDHLSYVNTMVTTNHSTFDFFMKHGSERQKGGICEWDRYPFDHESCGIPIRHQIFEEKLETETTKKRHIFHIDGCFCSWECAYAFLLHNKGLPSRFRNVKYTDSEQLLHYIWENTNTNNEKKELKEAPCYRLIRPYGPLTIEEYRASLTLYRDEHWSVFVPIKDVFRKF